MNKSNIDRDDSGVRLVRDRTMPMLRN